MRNLLSFFVCIISYMVLPTMAFCESKQYVMDFTSAQSLPDGWVKGNKVDFKAINDINCLFFGIRGGSTYDYILSSPIFYKVTRISVWVEKIDRNTDFTLYFESPTGEMLQSNLYKNTSAVTSRREIVFENNAEYPFPIDDTNYCISMFANNVYVSSITITYEERPKGEDNVTAFILKNFFGGDDAGLSWTTLKTGEVQTAFTGTAQYISSLFYASLQDDGCITITAPNITKVDVATHFLGRTIFINGEETAEEIASWTGSSDKVELTPPTDGQSCLTAIAVYTNSDGQTSIAPKQISETANALGSQGKILINGTYDRAAIYNMTGTLVESLPCSSTGQTTITANAGCYIVKFDIDSHIFSQKVIVR